MFPLLFLIVITGVTARTDETEYTPFDGWYNNLLHPDWGASDTQLLRRSKVAYADSVYHPAGHHRPNPLDISQAAHQGPAGSQSYAGRTAMLVYFGQQIVEEIVDSQRVGCPVEYFNVPVPKGHPHFDSGNKGNVEMTFKRTRYDQRTGYSPNNPRQQLNEITPFIDGQVIYGPNKAWSDAIRSLKGGRLAGTNPGTIMQEFPINNTIRLPYANPPVAREHVLKPVSRFHTIGNPRGHENPFLLSFGILWFRWHNFVADSVARENPDFNDEQIFNIARMRVIALYQKIVFYDWLPIWLDSSMSTAQFKSEFAYKQPSANSHYNGYNPSVHPGIYHEFQAAAMRFGHTLVTPGLWRRTASCEYLKSTVNDKTFAAIRLCNSYWNSRESVEEDLDSLLRGMATTIAEREDSILVTDLTDSLFGPLEFSRRDLAALNIQRGRDHGLPDYNTVRQAYGLSHKETWEDINQIYNTEEIQRLKHLYGNSSVPDNVDLFTGGMLETTDSGPGELFQKIILEQFLRIRHGDRFWFENTDQSGLTPTELQEVWNTDLIDVITRVTGVGTSDTQYNVFLSKGSSGCQIQRRQLQPGQTFQGIDMLEPCSTLQNYDYFSGSEVSFAMTFLVAFLCIPVTFLIMYVLAQRRQRSRFKCRSPPPPLGKTSSSNPNEFKVLEWVDYDELERICTLIMDPVDNHINIYNTKKTLLRYADVKLVAAQNNNNIEVHISSDKLENLSALKLPEYDMVLKFFNQEERTRFLVQLDIFLSEINVKTTTRSLVESYILRNAITRQNRQERLNKFFKKILNMFHDGETEVDENIYGPIDHAGDEISRIELTQAEFGEAFGMNAHSTFVKHMFLLVDADKSGHVSFREFMDVFILLSSDDVDSKIQLLFNMYDINRHGYLNKEDLYKMVRSLLGLSENNVTDEKITEFAEALYKSAGLRSGVEITYTDFKRVFTSDKYVKTLKDATMELNVTGEDEDKTDTLNTLEVPGMHSKMMQRRMTLVRGYSICGTLSNTSRSRGHSVSSSTGSGQPYNTISRATSISRIQVHADNNRKAPVGLMEIYEKTVAYLDTYRLQVFWMTLYILITVGIFAERAHYYAIERENGGLRRVAGQGVTMSRGSASVIMFTYSWLMVTMCKNLITVLRETFLHRFIPFDSIHSMHKFVACLSLVFTVLHVIFHGINLYQISTQPSTDLNCYFREYYRASHELASFQYWAFGTTTGFSGIILTVLVVVLFVFALPYARRHLFHAFWNTHKLYFCIYIFLLIHGSARMVQDPHFPYYFIGPALLFTIDKLISTSRTKIELAVVQARLLPSEVTSLKVKKPNDFEYKSGQWVQVACDALGQSEFHPLTLTSAPHETFLTFHIRAVGPWTSNLRRIFDPSNHIGKCHPKLLLDGPFGEGHQDWYRYEVSVLIGGGIGVTPFASILKDIVHKSVMEIKMQCKKVYFLWVTRTQKQFEWVTDIIRDLEAIDHSKFVTTHIFVTEFKTNFDLRTSMLYICERHFQKIAGKSLFTGLEATTHFGRPRFYRFLESLRYEHNNVKKIGVFSCGPRPMTLSVEKSCSNLNKIKEPTYYHHYENF